MIDELERAKHVAEPVAWRSRHENRWIFSKQNPPPNDGYEWQPLYAHPPIQVEPATQANASGGYVPPNPPTSEWNDAIEAAADIVATAIIYRDANTLPEIEAQIRALKREPR